MKKSSLKLGVVCGAVVLASMGFSETYAVCMGINKYPVPVDKNGSPFKDEKGNLVSANLNGAVNDAVAMRELLVGKYSVKTENVKFLTDADANAAGFLDAVRWLIKNAKAGDNIVFSYSGHGSQIPDKTQPSGKASVIVLSDNKLVTGNFFKEVSASMKKAGINATFVFDSCFAGAMNRDPKMADYIQVKTKSLKSDDIYMKKAKLIAKTDLSGILQSAKALPAKQDLKGEIAFLFASKDDETSSDLTFKDQTKPPRGLFTLLITSILGNLPKAPLNELVDAIKAAVKENGFKQTPNSEFSSEERGKAPLVTGG